MKDKHTPLDQALDYMKRKVNDNINIINRNSETIKNIISKEPPSPNREEKLKILYGENKTLFNENNALLDIQKKTVDYKSNFLIPEQNKKYYDAEDDSIVEEISFEECFYRTLDGSLSLNPDHPMIDNEEFLSLVLDHYTQHEQYEKCADVNKYLIKLTNKTQNQCQQKQN